MLEHWEILTHSISEIERKILNLTEETNELQKKGKEKRSECLEQKAVCRSKKGRENGIPCAHVKNIKTLESSQNHTNYLT